VLVLLAVVVVFALGESKRWRLWLVWFIVLTEDGAVGRAKMAHTVKLANGPPNCARPSSRAAH